MLPAADSHSHLGWYIIDGIDYKICMKGRNKLIIRWIITLHQRLHITGGIDPFYPFRHHFRLVSSQRGKVCHQLPVHIGLIHYILINENQMSHSGSAQCFTGIGAYPTGTKHSHGGRLKGIHSVFSDDTGCSLKQQVHYFPPGMISTQ